MGNTLIFCKFRTLFLTCKEHYFLKFVNKRKIIYDLTKNAAKNLEFILKISIDLVIIITVEHRTQSFFFVEQVTLRKNMQYRFLPNKDSVCVERGASYLVRTLLS